ncbi:undecaprenyl-phosphate glucose phosphotransferase [Sulfurimicrobium lacus]|nr:undecaprenyl-phosphate glucose phosphotransferase [Sulfurimicrobium lacus]
MEGIPGENESQSGVFVTVMRRGLLKEHSSILNAVLHLLDWAGIIFAAWLAHRLYLGNSSLPAAYGVVIGIVVLLSALLFPRFNLYEAWRGASLFDEVRAMTLAWALVLSLLFAFAFTTKMGIQFSRGWIGIWSVLGWSALVCGRLLLRVGLRWLRSHGYNQRRIVIVGTEGLGEELAERLLISPWIGLQVTGFFNVGGGAPQPGVPVLGGLPDVADYVAKARIDQVWIALPLKDQDKVESLLHELRHSVVDIRFVPDIFGFRLLNHSVTEVAGFPVMNLSATPMVGVNRLVKAVEDRLLALLILLMISPLMLLIALGVKLSSPGPVLFKQGRLGWDGQPFKVYKFRSMVVHQETGGQLTQASRGDARVTPFGAFLRRSSLDELPQFFNVLQGTMSIVGPRPHAISHNEQYKELIDDYMQRHKVKPGITGWAQINGWRGETDTLEKMSKRVEYDLYYIENWSLWFDLRIILLTVFKGFINKNAY